MHVYIVITLGLTMVLEAFTSVAPHLYKHNEYNDCGNEIEESWGGGEGEGEVDMKHWLCSLLEMCNLQMISRFDNSSNRI